MCSGFFCTDLSGVVQILFWITAGTLAVLTYRQARKSLFQPLRVEVFKYQVELLTQVNALLALKQETELRQFFDFDAVLAWNSRVLMEAYAWTTFTAQPPPGGGVLDSNREVLIGALISLPLDEYVELVAAPEAGNENKKPREEPTKAEWSDYRHGAIHITRNYSDAVSTVEALIRNPLLPEGLRPLLEELLEAVSANILAVGTAMDEVASQLPISYPSLAAVQSSELSWVQNTWNSKATTLEPIADRIVQWARSYLQTDDAGFLRGPRGSRRG
jgi:hypothetical protein